MSEEKAQNEQQEKKDIKQLLEEIEIRSEAVQEILGFIPHWIIRWGITLIFAVVIMILVGSYYFKYPDIIPSTIVLTTKNPPVNLIARSSGKIEKLFVEDNQRVQANDIVAVIENTANYQHVFRLKDNLKQIRAFIANTENAPLPEINFGGHYILGQLQTAYASFLNSYNDYERYIRQDFYRKRIKATRDQIKRHQMMLEQTIRKTALAKKELSFSQKSLDDSKKLFKDGIISRKEFDTQEIRHVQQQSAYESAKQTLISSRDQIDQLKQNIVEFEHNDREDRKRLISVLNQSYETLSGQLAQWEQAFLLIAPISGTATFTKIWSSNQNVNPGDRVVTIVPEKGGKIFGRVVLPIQGSGKVKVGQRVNIKFTNFPHMDYGIVTGTVTSKSLVASDNSYVLEVELTKGLITSYGKELEFSQEMQGTAEIITEDIRLLERVFRPIKNILDKMGNHE
jgi:multidrug efflux pump subunit AcrA (membrane-fusion protein)